MAESVTLSSAPPARKSQNYSVLREDGLQLIRAWASDSWTDHNAHDPGITVLEACSYAMTELGLRLQVDVADLVRSGEHNAAADLEPAHRVLPSGPVTPQDLRSLLLDHPLVSDAQIFLPADNEVPFYELQDADPPLTFTAGTARVRTSGLYEVLVELADRPLNSNTYLLTIVAGGQSHAVELALPFWDDVLAAPFRAGATVNTIAMVPDGTEFWRALPEPQSYFGRLNVAYTGSSGPGTVELWALLFITEDLAQPSLEIPDILTEARNVVEFTAAGAPLALFTTRVRSASRAVDQLRSYVAGWRNLGEQAVRIGVARVQEIAVRARIEVTGGIDVEQLLANLFMDFDQMLSPQVRFESLADRRKTFDSAERIYDGPLLRRGFLSAESLGATRPDVLYTSDLLRLIMRRRTGSGSDLVTQENPVGRDIVAVTDLALSNFINNRPITIDADNCLHLVEIDRYRPRLSIVKSHIVVVRNDAEVIYDLARVVSLFENLLAQAAEGAVTSDPSPVWPVPRGELLPVEDYTPLQEELPATYGVGRAALPDSAPAERHAAAKQMQGYLLLFEQLLGDVTAQLGNVNRFFSIDGGEGVTYFTRPPFDLPGITKLLRRFPAGGSDWPAFISDPANPVVRALHDAAEDAERLLDRRNRMLDHRLARHGEDAVAFGQELHRWARQELVAGNAPVTPTPASIAARREAANARLVRIKAAFVDDVPELNAFRLLAHGNPFHRDASIMRVDQTGANFRWRLSLQGQELLRANADFTSSAAAGIAAENAFAFAGRAAHFTVAATAGGQQQLRLMDGTAATAQQIAESSQTWSTEAAANAALAQISAAFAALRLESSPAPLERRVAHLTGIRSRIRRRLLAATNLHFEIFDDPPGGGLFGRRWRLWELPGNTGQQLLVSPIRFEAATAAVAIELAQRSIRQVLRFGIDEWNYRVPEPPGNPLTYELTDPSLTVIARSSAPLGSADAVAGAIRASVDLLYRVYGAEGFHLVDHVLLRPRAVGQPFLSLPASPTTRDRDPYSQRISCVLPSGFARDFSSSDDTAPLTEVTPDRFRDLESRRHIERMIQQACPAHLMPTVYWVDRDAAGNTSNPASFDAFEQRYFDWLDTVLIPGAPAATIDTTRADLMESLNAIANDAT